MKIKPGHVRITIPWSTWSGGLLRNGGLLAPPRVAVDRDLNEKGAHRVSPWKRCWRGWRALFLLGGISSEEVACTCAGLDHRESCPDHVIPY